MRDGCRISGSSVSTEAGAALSPTRPGVPTPPELIDVLLARLRVAAERWPRVDTRERVDFLNACRAGVRRVAAEWVELSCRHQGVGPDGAPGSENWLSGPWITMRTLRLLGDALRQGGSPRPPALRQRGGGWVADVAPIDRLEALMFRGIRAELRVQSGKPPERGAVYRRPVAEREGGVALVLGAGNVSAIASRDLLHQLFVENRVVLLKMHPVNEFLGPLFERAFASLVEAGYLAVIYGDAETGRYGCQHDGVDAIHLTGSHHTHDAIVWGAGSEERARRRAADAPVLDKPVTAELGCVSPVIVVPGDWTDAELDYQARSVAGMVTHNASFNCNAAKLVITQRGWPRRHAFLDALGLALAATPTRPAYYPGAEARYEEFRAACPDARPLGAEPPRGEIPWTLVTGIDPVPGSYPLSREAFCGVLAETALPASDAAEFLRSAVELCNRHVWGSLSAMLLVDPRTERRLAGAVDRAVDELRYGGVAVNCWSALLFALCTPSWGAYPGNDRRDVGSGVGFVGGNTFLFDHPCKSVVRMPFVAWPKPTWFADHRTIGPLGRRLVAYEASPGWHHLPGLALAAARG